MADLSLPVDHFKKLAKTLKTSVGSATPEACARVRAIYNDAADKTDAEIASDFGLMRAQHVVAVEHGFRSWDALLAASPVEARLAITMERIPELNDFGIGLYGEHHKKPKDEQQAIYEKNRKVLRSAVEPVRRTVDWLRQNVEPVKTINSKRSSYGLKHIAEQDVGYITNGVFIAAAIIAGYGYKIDPGSPNVPFAMSEKSLKQIVRRRSEPGYVSDGGRDGTEKPRGFFETISDAIRNAHPNVKLNFVDGDKRLEVRLGAFEFAVLTPRNAEPAWPVVIWKETPGEDWRDRGSWECVDLDDVLTVLRWPDARPYKSYASVNEIRDNYENPAKHVWVRAHHKHPVPDPLMATWECSGCGARVYLPFGEELETYVRYGFENWRDRGKPRSGPPRTLSNSMTVAAIPPRCPQTTKPAAPPDSAEDLYDAPKRVDPYESNGIDPYASSGIDPYESNGIDPYGALDEEVRRAERG